MGKAKRGYKERSRERELTHENQKLRRENSRLRKQLGRLDLDRYSQVKDIIDEHYAGEETEANTQDMLNSLKNTWLCRECNSGHMEINLYTKMNGTWYFRKCSNCDHRTKSQEYSPSVKGIIKEVPLKPEKMTGKKS